MNKADAAQAGEPIVAVSALCRTFGEGNGAVHALRGIDLSIGRGEFVAVMGPSGSGKSTLLHLIGGLCAPSSGRVIIEGRDLSGLNDDELTLLRRRRIGFIFQAFNLLPALTAIENIALPIAIDGVPSVEAEASAAAALRAVGLEARAGALPGELSGGEQQRVAIARAIAGTPLIVLADEPTGNLDSENSALIIQQLGRLARERAQTILMVTHDHRSAAAADRVIRLEDGRIIGDERIGGERDRRAILARRLE